MTNEANGRREGTFSLGLLLLSAAVLLLEVGQVRIFSFFLWHHVTYLVVTVTLLGFAAGGTWLAVSRKVVGELRAARSAFLFGVCALATFWVLARNPIAVLPQADMRFPALSATLSYLYLVVPFFFGGLAVAAALDGDGKRVSRRYGVNMIGSALGCLLVMPLLRACGGAGVVLAAAALALLGGAFLWFGAGRLLAGAGAALAALVACAFIGQADALLPFPVAAGKTLDLKLKGGEPLLESRWDPICRVDVAGDEARAGGLLLFQDGDAPTSIPAAAASSDDIVASHPALGYLLALDVSGKPWRSRDKALVIGVGGGRDVKTALLMGASEITGAEINASTAELMRDRFGAYCGGLYTDPRVQIIVADGRSVVARSGEKYDIIQITGADTYAALASGANIVAESYLYTMEAIRDYLDHLTDQGVLVVMRFRFYPPRETLRLAGMAARVLKEKGAAEPERHIAVINIDLGGETARYAYTVVKKTPFGAAELMRFRQFCEELPQSRQYHPAFLQGGENEPEFQGYLDAITAGEEEARAFEEAYPYAIDPVTDDRPFFFQYFRRADVLAERAEEKGRSYFHSVIGFGPAGLQVLWLSLIVSLLLIAVLVLGPLLFLRRGGLKVAGGWRLVLFFSALGLAYLAVEIATMQRLTLYLGHPLKALGLGLTTFLMASGLGAAFSARFALGAERRGAFLGAALAALCLVLHIVAVPAVFRGTLFLADWQRDALSVSVIAPLAFFMGMPFPLGLRLARASAAPLLPWAFGVNGGASVIASVLAILFAMERGFSAVLVACVLLYVLASLALPRPRGTAG